MLEIKNLYATIDSKEILNGVDLIIKENETHIIMGPNGSGKTTLAKAIFGHPSVKITKGDILFNGKSILELPINERAILGMFFGFQNPVEIDGVGFVNLLRSSREAIAGTANMKELMQEIKSGMKELSMEENLVGRSVNKGLSGGEKKKAEILQLMIQKPKLAILDEPDSGLDMDALKAVASGIKNAADKSHMSLIVITHYSRILPYIDPQYIHIMVDGKIVANGGNELVEILEKEGYKSFEEKK
jgi:Fe-S cluster assembly ATP-binding protein